jgi:RNA polymerase sigma factor (sigma-70 family)
MRTTEKDNGTILIKTIDHLFRVESGRLVSVLTRIFGSQHIDLAEDVVQDSFTEAINHWAYKGIPDNPTAWIFRVAKNKALNILNREKYKRQFSSEVAHFLQSEWTAEPSLQKLFSEHEIADDQLRMIFTCCHPGISEDSQIALTLRTLCGFNIPEIARAFLTDEENINKRLVRARKYIREHDVEFDVPAGSDLEERQDAVLETMYLMFNEGYSTLEGDDIIRLDLCKEAIRLTGIIAAHPKIRQKNNVYGLLSLMLLNASRFNSRESDEGSLINLADQDRTLWDRKMIEEGLGYLYKSFKKENEFISKYQIMAAISAHHCTAESDETTDWTGILSLYDNLMQLDPCAIVLLNRAVALFKVFDAQRAIDELEKLKNEPVIKKYPYYYSVLGEFYLMTGKHSKAAEYFRHALTRTRNRKEIKLLKEKIHGLEQQPKN